MRRKGGLSAPEKAVCWTDINRFLVHRHDIATGAVRSWQSGEPAVGLPLAIGPGGKPVILASRPIRWRPATGRRQDHGVTLPDGPVTDAKGDVWNCRFGGGCIAGIALVGSLRQSVENPVPNNTHASSAATICEPWM